MKKKPSANRTLICSSPREARPKGLTLKPLATLTLLHLALSLGLSACQTNPSPTLQKPLAQASSQPVSGEIAPLPKGPRPQPEETGPSSLPVALKLPQLSFGTKQPGTGAAGPVLAPPSFGPGSGGFPTGVGATSDISVVEKTTLNGKIFNNSHQPVDGATVTVRSLNSSVPFEATATTAGGSFAFNNAPSGVSVEIVVQVPGAAPRRRVEVLKSNKTGDPNANRYDFGTDGSTTFGSDANSISDLPEVVSFFPGRNASGIDPHTNFKLTFSEPMDKASVEAALIVRKKNAGASDTGFDISAFDVSWNTAESEILLKFKPGYQLEAHQSYTFAFKPDAMIKDKSGVGRSGSYFKLTDGSYESDVSFNILGFMTQALEPVIEAHPQNANEPEPTVFPTPVPTATPTPVATPAPAADSDYFFFSYDDSASTAGVELTKAALARGEMPKPEWVRPWEFLNLEHFDPAGQQSTGLFKVSLGLWKHADVDYKGYDTYEFGAQVAAPELDRLSRRNLVLTLVLDVSGSMDEAANPGSATTKLALARSGLAQLVKSLKSGDVVNLVTFSNAAEIPVENYQVGENSQGYLDQVSRLQTTGGTNLEAGLHQAYLTARKYYDANKINRVVMLTDAYANEGGTDPNRIAYYTAINHAEGIYFSGLGFGYNFNEAFLDQLTEKGHGAYFSILNEQDMSRAFGERFMALINVAARDVRFRLDYPKVLQRFQSAAEESSKVESHVQPTNFSYNTSQYFLEQFVGPHDDSLLSQPVRLTIDYLDPISGQRKVEIVEKKLGELLEHETGNIQDAHLVTLLASVLKGEIGTARAQAEMALIGPRASALGKNYAALLDKALKLKNPATDLSVSEKTVFD